jgi:RNA polymerase sigma factor (sigma-70 family)
MYLISGDRHEAEDLAQEACLRVYERWEVIRTSANPAGYAYRIAANLHRSRLRRLRVAARHVLRRAEPAWDGLAAAEERDLLRRALADLPLGQREALILLEWGGLTDTEVAETLGLSPVAVRMRASRARKLMRERIRRGDHDD